MNSTSGARSLIPFFLHVHGKSFELSIYAIARSQRWIAEFRAPGQGARFLFLLPAALHQLVAASQSWLPPFRTCVMRAQTVSLMKRGRVADLLQYSEPFFFRS